MLTGLSQRDNVRMPSQGVVTVRGDQEESKNVLPENVRQDALAFVSVEDTLMKITETFQRMPDCAERTAIILRHYLLLQQQGIKELPLGHFQKQSLIRPRGQFQQVEEEAVAAEEKEPENLSLVSLIEQAKNQFVLQLENEGILSGVRSDFMEGSRNCPSVVAAIKSRDYLTASQSLSFILKRLRPFDVRETAFLLEKAAEAAHSVKGQDIILLLGDTGAGKSTTIHFLAGSQFEEVQEQGMWHLKPIKVKNPALQEVETSAAAKSVTRYVRAVPISYEDVGLSKKGRVVLCDTPGFGDTAGPEVDVANSLGIITAIKGAKTVKIVNLISYKGIGDRLQGVKRLVRTLSAFVSNIEEHKDTFSFFFTKYPKKEEETLNATLKSVFDELSEEERADKIFVGLLEEMLDQTAEGAVFVRPLQDKPGSLLKKLSKGDKIERPLDVFRFSISRESRAAMDAQVADARRAITFALRRHDYTLIHYRLNELHLLQTMLSDDASLKASYQDALKEVTQSMTCFYTESIESFDRCLIEDTVLTETTARSYQSALSIMTDMDRLRGQHLANEGVSVELLRQHFHNSLLKFKERVLKHTSFDRGLQKSLDKFSVLAMSFPQAGEMYAEIITDLNLKVDDLLKKAQQAMDTEVFDEVAHYLSDLASLSHHFASHLKSEMILVKVEQFKASTLARFRTQVSEFSEEFVRVIDNESLFIEERGIDQGNTLRKSNATIRQVLLRLQAQINLFERLCQHAELSPLFGKEPLDREYQRLMATLQHKVQTLCSEISVLYDKDKEVAFKPIGFLLERIEFVRALSPCVVMKTDVLYNTMVSKLYGYVQESKRRVDHMLDKLLAGEGLLHRHVTEDYNQLTSCLSALRDVQWIDTVNGGVYKGTYGEVHHVNLKRVEQHVGDLVASLKQMPFSFKHPECIVRADKLLQGVDLCTKVLSTAIPLVIETQQEARAFFNQAMMALHRDIDQLFNLEEEKSHFSSAQALKRVELIELKAQFADLHQAKHYLAEQQYGNLESVQQAIQVAEAQLQEKQTEIASVKAALYCKLQEYGKHKQELHSILNSGMSKERTKRNAEEYITEHQLNKASQPDIVGAGQTHVKQKLAELEKQLAFYTEQSQQAIVLIEQKIRQLQDIKTHYQRLTEEPNHDPRAAELLQRRGFSTFAALTSELVKVERAQEQGLDVYSIDKELRYDVFALGIAFFSELKRFPLFLRYGEEGDEKIAQCMNRYMTVIKRQLDYCLDYMESSPSQEFERVDFFIQLLFKRFKELTHVRAHFPIVFDFFPKDILSAYFERLAHQHDELSERIPALFMLGDLAEHHVKLTLAKKLSLFDGFLEGTSRSYRELYVEQRKAMDTALQNIPSLNQHMAQHDYYALASALHLLDRKAEQGDAGSRKTLETAKRSLARHLTDYITEVINIATLFGYDMNAENIQPLLEGVNRLMQAKQFLIEYIEDEPLKLRLEQAPNEISTTVGEGVTQFLQALDAAIKSNDFEEVENRKTAAKKIRSMLKGVVQSQLLEQMQNIDKNVENQLLKIVSRYVPSISRYQNKESEPGEPGEEYKEERENGHAAMSSSPADLSVYRLYPPRDVLENLKKVHGKHSMYKRCYDNLRKDIDTRLREEIAKLERYNPIDKKKKERDLKAVIRSLSEDLQTSLSAELENTSQDIEESIQEMNSELGSVIERNALEEIAKKYRSVDAHPNAIIFQRYLQGHLVKDAQRQIVVLSEEISASRVSVPLLQAIKRLFDANSLLGHAIPQLNQFYQHGSKELNDFFARLSAGLLAAVTEERVDHVVDALPIFSEFIKLMTDPLNAAVLTHVLLEFNSTTEKVHSALSLFFENKQAIVTKSRAASQAGFDQVSLSGSLVFFKQCDGLLDKLKDYVRFHQKKFPDLKTLADIIFNEQFSLQAFKKESLSCLKRHLDDLLRQEFDNEETRVSEKQRDAFFQGYFKKFSLLDELCQVDTIAMYLPEAKQLTDQGMKLISDKVTKLIQESVHLTQYDTLKRFDDKRFDRIHQNLLSLQRFFHEHTDLQAYAKKIEECFDKKFKEAVALAEKRTIDVKSFSDSLIQLKQLGMKVSLVRIRVNESIDELLRSYKNKQGRKGAQAITDLGVALSQDIEGIGPCLLEDHKIFKGYTLALFNASTARQDIHYVISKIEGDNIDKGKLQQEFEQCDVLYKETIDRNLRSKEMDLDGLIRDIRQVADPLRDKARKKEVKGMGGYIFSRLKEFAGMEEKNVDIGQNTLAWPQSTQDKMHLLIAQIFALWTLKNSEYYFEMKEGGGSGQAESTRQYLMQPHPAQIIAIFRMLGIGYERRVGLPNNLQQVLTGEGKSLVLAVTSAILALLGFEVYVASYSQYLSRRDQEAAHALFDDLGVLSSIHYGTFNELCESVINSGVAIRSEVTGLLSGAGLTRRQASTMKPRILLVDEVDVFFNKDFYGNTYTPSATLQDPTIHALISFIWRHREEHLTLRKIEGSQEYQACLNRFGDFRELITEAVKDILADLADFGSHDYVCKEDKIGYKEQDGIAFNIVFGYKTLFAYYREYEKKNITQASLEAHSRILINCGEYSYAEVTRQFVRIMGVTGTLRTLHAAQQRVIREKYQIRCQSYVPSVYGDNQRVFHPDQHTLIEKPADHFATIVREMKTALTGSDGSDNKRAVLVFFENKEKLLTFFHSRELSPLRDNVQIMTEECTDAEKKERIRKATFAGQMTLLTSAFGRGTDFVSLDKVVSNNGGVHVIQTFLSESKSEETQIQGRTARQGAQGSYTLILHRQELEKYFPGDAFEKVMQEMERTGHKYDVLDQARNAFFEGQYKDCERAVMNIASVHEKSEQFLFDLIQGNIDEVKKYLLERNRGAMSNSQSRTICLMDATGSMANLLNKAKLTVSDMFDRASQVLEVSGLNPQVFEMQFAVYRNYSNDADTLLQASTWESKSAPLRVFMNTIGPDGGWGNEAIEMGLWHVNREMEQGLVTQVILIGDAPPNTPEEVHQKRSHFGEAYWRATKFGASTDYTKQLKPIIKAAIPIHTFYVAKTARPAFKEIARSTGGQSCFLDVSSSKGAEDLTNCVTEQILQNVGGAGRGDELVARYKKMFTGK